ncbi:hypothetical protein H2200_012836 [Cladophialophora chaetospira]|uniref:NmrA-like domain-containing protein n=1 Tax=Cladophialophora chaetospira TaxID=386627 RepID=A0AA39CBX5_9EURO|nr:hypothetical protein H2200_012836 [Cladophialophora chaetospira]
MLVLIVGITGNVGQKLVEPLRKRGAQVRGLARHKSKMNSDNLLALESFHDMEAWHDVPAIRKALRGVDTVICAYGPVPELVLEGQLLLVRLMEEQGISRFIPAAWNLDWTALDWGDIVYYDLFLATQRQLAVSPTIKPLYVFIGFFAETFFSLPSLGVFNPATHGVWDSNDGAPRAEFWGTGDEKWQITTEQEAAEFTAALVCDQSRQSGRYRYCSWEYSIKEIAAVYEKEKGIAVRLEPQGTLDDLKAIAAADQHELGLSRFWEWMGYTYQIHHMSGKALMTTRDDNLYPEVKKVGLGQFLREYPEI